MTRSKRESPPEGAVERGSNFGSRNDIEKYVGAEIRKQRRARGMTLLSLAQRAGISQGMMSKTENGLTSPSLSTLAVLAEALNIPLASLFTPLETKRDVSYVAAGEGVKIDRQGTRAGHLYELLGYWVRGPVTVEPYLITLSEDSEPFGDFYHAGVEFIYVREGELEFRHGNRTYHMKPGDSLFFDAVTLHGPVSLIKRPCRFLSIIAYSGGGNEH